MSQMSPRVSLPYLQPSQAQKHVTHNEALQQLDAVTQLTVQGFADMTPPELPVAGDIHGVGSGAMGAWAGQDGMLAYWEGTGWLFLSPQPGWRAWGLADQELRVWRDGAWHLLLDQVDMLGVNTGADLTNRLSVASAASLFSHDGAGHQMKINKAAETDTASLLFQSNWVGHAEMGLAGDTGFALKLSSDGAAWDRVLHADPVTQEITLAPAGTARMVLGDDQLALDVPVTGGAVQSGVTDTTQGRLMTVGAFGNGVAVTLEAGDDLNTLLTGGAYFNPTTHNTTGNNYPIASAGSLTVVGRSNANITQTFRTYGGSLSEASGVRVFERTYGGLGWTPWVELYHSANILGAVSHLNGMPTGALIEAGSNANGQYWRFADGIQICAKKVTLSGQDISTAYGTMYRSDNLLSGQTVYAATFVAPPACAITVHVENYTVLTSTGGVGDVNNTPSTAYAVSVTSLTNRIVHTNVVAIGRWF